MLPDRAAQPGSAPATEEIEVTPEMIEAGLQVYFRRDTRYESEEDIVAEIYSAMAGAHTKKPMQGRR